MKASKQGVLGIALAGLVVHLLAAAVLGQEGEPNTPQPTVRTGCYVFLTEQSTIVQTGGFAGVHRTYALDGRFCLILDPDAKAAHFERIEAGAVGADEPAQTLDPNETFNLTNLTGAIIDETTVEFTGQAADGSNVSLTVIFDENAVCLTGQTTPPPNSADFFLFSIEAVAPRKYAGGTGAPDAPYQIATAEQMDAIGSAPNDWDKHFRLTADIDLSAYDGQDGRPAFNIIAPDIDPNQWDFQGTPFTGVFDGNDCTITSFQWSDGTASYIGLFGYVSDPNAEIKNLRLTDPNVSVDEGSGVGALAGYVAQGTIRNCSVEGGLVRGSSRIGGLVGESTGTTITSCHVDCSVLGDRYVGGLVGDNTATIHDCSVAGTVFGNEYVGGIAGFDYTCQRRRGGPVFTGAVNHCHSSASVSGNEGVGGLVGRMYGGWAIQSRATGPVYGNYAVGGLVGLNGGDVVACYATGVVTGGDCAGGLVGLNWEGLSDCYATGAVSGSDAVGGLIGLTAASVANCYATGDVSGESRVGGLIGSADWVADAVIASLWDVETSGQDKSAAGTGLQTAEMQTAAPFLEAGWDFVGETDNGVEDIWWIEEGQDYPRLWWEAADAEF